LKKATKPAPTADEVEPDIERMSGKSGRSASQLGVPFFVKQLGSNPVENGKPLKFKDCYGGDWSEWPQDLRIRQVLAAFRS
jgi:hypothetical protein